MKTTKFVSSFLLFLMLWGGVMGQARDGSSQVNGVNCAFCQQSMDVGLPPLLLYHCLLINYNDGSSPSSPANPINKPGYTLIMQDEFNAGAALDSACMPRENYSRKWTVFHGPDWFKMDTLNGLMDTIHLLSNPVYDWHKNQVTKHATNGTVEIAMTKQNAAQHSWLSSEMLSKLKFRYGYVEARIKATEGCGLFESFWLWGKGNGDINAFEFWYNVDPNQNSIEQLADLNGVSNNFMFSQYWCPSPPCYDNVPIGSLNRNNKTDYRDWVVPMDQDGTSSNAFKLDLSKDFFIYGVEWDPVNVKLYINNTLIKTFPNKLTKGTNIALTLGGYYHNDLVQNGKGLDHPLPTPSPSKMTIDYVRVYKKNTTFNSMLDHFPNVLCVGKSVTTLAYEDFVPTDNPNATYELSVVSQPAGNTAPIQITPFWSTDYTGTIANGPDWGNILNVLTVPANALIGNYVIKLSLKPRVNGINDTTTLRAYKTISVINTLPPQPSLTSSVVSCACKITLTTSNATSHTWTVDGDPLSSSSNTFYLNNGETSTFSAAGINPCGTGTYRTRTFTCALSNCPLRLATPDPTNSDIVIDEVITDGQAGSFPVLYPNPLTGNELWVTLPEDIDAEANIEIRTPEGLTLLTQSLVKKETAITIPNLQKGTYFCILHDKNGYSATYLLIIQP